MSKSVPVKSNLLQQNCFVRDVSLKKDLHSTFSVDSYISLDEKISDNGYVQEYNSYPYPITPQYVQSFVDSVDYRRDPANAVANGVHRVNLGDVGSIQRLYGLDSSNQRALYEQLKSKFSKPTSDIKPASDTTGGDK